VDAAGRYRLLLIQSSTGARTLVLQNKAEQRTLEGVFAFTDEVPNELLLKRNLQVIAKAITLSNGEPFYVDAHGVWLTKDEMAAILEDNDDNEIPWLNSLPPRLAPK
jgi:hypothetical protein